MTWHIRGIAEGPRLGALSNPVIELEVLLTVSLIAVRLNDLVLLHPVPLVGFVTSDSATRSRSQ